MSDHRERAEQIVDGILKAGFYINLEHPSGAQGVVDAVEKILDHERVPDLPRGH